MEKLTKEEVLHVADLARLKLDENEIEDYAYKLKAIMDSISLINSIEVTDNEMTISPSTAKISLFKEQENKTISKADALKNAPNKIDPYIYVGGSIDE